VLGVLKTIKQAGSQKSYDVLPQTICMSVTAF